MGKYLPHVERSVRRLGYLKADSILELASLMDEYDGHHPHQIARKFRQTGSPLSRDEKKAIGLRANADMTTEALASLTEKGLSSPIKGIEATLLDASFAFFRLRSTQGLLGTELEPYTKFHIRSAWPDCQGCTRLKGSEIHIHELGSLPPPDCSREACALGVNAKVDFIQQAIDHGAMDTAPEPSKRQSWLMRILGR